jgi:hypothetical protein
VDVKSDDLGTDNQKDQVGINGLYLAKTKLCAIQ